MIPRSLLILCCTALMAACATNPTTPDPAADEAADATPAEQGEANGEGGSTSIVDDVGRVVEVEVPVASAIVYNNYNLEFMRAIGAADTVLAISDSFQEEPDYWGDFGDNFGAGSQGEPNWETIAEENPEVVILPRNGAWEEAEERLEPFGITTVVVTGWDEKKHEFNVSTLGVMFDRQEEAERLNEFHARYRGLIEERLDGVPRRPVYWEAADDHHTVVPGSGWHDMIEAARGQNIFGDVTSTVVESGATGSVHSFEIDAEDILLREPEVIVKVGHSNYASSSDELRAPLEEMVQRPGWSEVPAVQNGDVYSITRFAGGAVSKMIGSLYLATWLYPDRFEDVDPDDVFREWIEDFQGAPLDEPGSHTASIGS